MGDDVYGLLRVPDLAEPLDRFRECITALDTRRASAGSGNLLGFAIGNALED